MGWFSSTWWGPQSAGGGTTIAYPAFPVIANSATVETIRDQIYTLIEALTPTINSHDKFHRCRNEDAADFRTDSETQPAGSLRRFQVRARTERNCVSP